VLPLRTKYLGCFFIEDVRFFLDTVLLSIDVDDGIDAAAAGGRGVAALPAAAAEAAGALSFWLDAMWFNHPSMRMVPPPPPPPPPP
jgi:hypothetical protein